jgi:hypothetical protein
MSKRKVIGSFVIFLLATPVTLTKASPSEFHSQVRAVSLIASNPACTSKLLWYTKGSDICAPTSIKGAYKWQKSIKKSDTTQFMKTCRSYFSTPAGKILCDWTQRYVDNVITMKGPKDNCLTYLKNLLNNAVIVGSANKTATAADALLPYSNKNSWICHP